MDKIVIDVLVPAAEPYDDSLKMFEKECAGIADSINWRNDSSHHVRKLFEALRDALSDLDARTSQTKLVAGLRTLFAHYLGYP